MAAAIEQDGLQDGRGCVRPCHDVGGVRFQMRRGFRDGVSLPFTNPAMFLT